MAAPNIPCRGLRAGAATPVRDAVPIVMAQQANSERTRRITPPRRTCPLRVLIPFAVLVSFSVLFVGIEELERFLNAGLPTGMRHALLTGIAALVTLAISALVYRVMHRQQQQLADTATQLTRLLEAYQENPQSAGRFENAHLVHCRHVPERAVPDCPSYTGPDERCWQVMALRHPGTDSRRPQLNIRDCQQCAVYRRSCPDELTELGEGINNLFYLLEQGAGRIGRMRDQILEKQKMAAIGQIAAGVAHEVCNPLSNISAVVQILRRRRETGVHAPQFDLIDRNVQRISGIVRQLTSFAQPVAEAWQPVDLDRIVSDVVTLLEVSIRVQEVEVRHERAASLPATFGNAAQLQQVALHLALNALDAMPHGGVLTLSTCRQDTNLVLTVGDTGTGISQEVGRHIFEPFYTTKEPGQGTGLGLAVTYGIVQEHGGTIDFDSQPGMGTTFTVTLPILDQPPDQHHAESNSAAC